MVSKKIWFGTPPVQCDVCERSIKNEFIDGATKGGPWACMCQQCHSALGTGLGTNRGQRYEFEAGEWVKVEG